MYNNLKALYLFATLSNPIMTTQKLFLLKIGILALLLQASSSTFFPKKVWTYSATGGYLDSPSVVKLCLLNMQHYVEQSGWQFMLLTQHNYTKYVSEDSDQRFKTLLNAKVKEISSQEAVEIIKLLILYENGGMWLDAQTFLLGDLSWISQINTTNGLYNRVEKQPQIVTFTSNHLYGGKNWTDGIYLYPGIQTWCFMAVKNSKFLKDWIDFVQLMKPFQTASNFPPQALLRLKEKKLQQSSKDNAHKVRAVVDYKMWSIDSRSGPLQMQFKSRWDNQKIWKLFTQQSLQQLKVQDKLNSYFIVFTKSQLNYTIEKITNYTFYPDLKYKQPIDQRSVFHQFLFSFGLDYQFVYSLNKDDNSTMIIDMEIQDTYKEPQRTNNRKQKIHGFTNFIIIFFISIGLYLTYKVKQRTSASNNVENARQNWIEIEEEPSKMKKTDSSQENQ